MLKSLIENLKEVKDFRKSQGKRYRLWEVLLVVVLGVMSGHQGYREIGYFVKANEVILKRTFKLYSEEMPSYSTIRRVMRGVDGKDLSKIVKEWSRENSPKLKGIEALAIDGKSLRSTVKDPGNQQQNMVIMVSLFSQETGLVLATEKFENKTGSEQAVAQEIIGKCGLKGKLITADALHCNVTTTRKIMESGNDYLIAVKKNQIKLYNQIEKITKMTKAESIDTQKERGHGREITRRVSVFKKSIKFESPWEHIESIIQVERWGYRGKKPYRETVYYISSIREKAEFFSQKIKGHWGIENQVHWVKDVLFKEDSMKIHQVQAATNWALVNTLGLNIFRGLGFLSITEGRRWLGNQWEKLLAISLSPR